MVLECHRPASIRIEIYTIPRSVVRSFELGQREERDAPSVHGDGHEVVLAHRDGPGVGQARQQLTLHLPLRRQHEDVGPVHQVGAVILVSAHTPRVRLLVPAGALVYELDLPGLVYAHQGLLLPVRHQDVAVHRC